MNFKAVFCGFAALVCVASSYGAEKSVKARIDVVGKDSGIGMVFAECSTDLVGSQADWMKEEKDKRLLAVCPVQTEWTKTFFSFIPKKSGSLGIALMTDGNNDSAFVDYDMITIEGAELLNGDFEQADAKGRPNGWGPMNEPVYDNKSGTAKSGNAFVKCSSKNRFNATIKVSEGQKVIITFWTRASK